jgi:phage gpG-like protein
MDLHQLKIKIEKMTANLSDYARTQAAHDIGEMAVEFYREAFRQNKKGFTDKSLTKWRPLIRPNHADGRSNILVRSEALRNSIEADVQEGKVTIRAEAFSDIGFNYAPVHNTGTDRVPQRMFVGHSAMLNKEITERLKRKAAAIIKNS